MSIPESGGGGVRANHRVVARSAWFWMMAMGCLMAGAQELPPMDVVKFAGLSPEAAAKEMTLPPGFKATLFAGEPDVRQPISFAIDHRSAPTSAGLRPEAAPV